VGQPDPSQTIRDSLTRPKPPRPNRYWSLSSPREGIAPHVRSARVGFLGHTYPAMLYMYTEFIAVHAQFGAGIPLVSVC
jgi:hypothetical protein